MPVVNDNPLMACPHCGQEVLSVGGYRRSEPNSNPEPAHAPRIALPRVDLRAALQTRRAKRLTLPKRGRP